MECKNCGAETSGNYFCDDECFMEYLNKKKKKETQNDN